jgi:hypothetical protein
MEALRTYETSVKFCRTALRHDVKAAIFISTFASSTLHHAPPQLKTLHSRIASSLKIHSNLSPLSSYAQEINILTPFQDVSSFNFDGSIGHHQGFLVFPQSLLGNAGMVLQTTQ